MHMHLTEGRRELAEGRIDVGAFRGGQSGALAQESAALQNADHAANGFTFPRLASRFRWHSALARAFSTS